MAHTFESKFESPTSAGSGDAHAGALHADSKINSIGELKAFQSANGQAQSSAEHHLPSLSFTDSGAGGGASGGAGPGAAGSGDGASSSDVPATRGASGSHDGAGDNGSPSDSSFNTTGGDSLTAKADKFTHQNPSFEPLLPKSTGGVKQGTDDSNFNSSDTGIVDAKNLSNSLRNGSGGGSNGGGGGGAAGDSAIAPASGAGEAGANSSHPSSSLHLDAAHQRIADDNKRIDAADKSATKHFKSIIN